MIDIFDSSQDGGFPRHVSLEAWQNVGIQLFGNDPNQWQFVCPDCALVQKPQDFLDLGMPQKMVDGICAFSCIRRWTDQGCLSKGQGQTFIVITPCEKPRPTFDWNQP